MNGVVDGGGSVFAAIPAVFVGTIDVDVGDGGFAALAIDDVATDQDDLLVQGGGGSGEASGDTGDSADFGPLAGGEIHVRRPCW